MGKYLDKEGVKYIWGKINNDFYPKTAVDTLLGKKANTDNPWFNGHIGGNTAYFENNHEGDSPYLGYFMNALALNRQKGGSCVMRNLTTGKIQAKDADMDICFNARPNYYSLPNEIAQSDTIEITVKTYRWLGATPFVGISFGAGDGGWGPHYAKIEIGLSASDGNAETPPADIQWQTIYERDTGPIAYATAYGGIGPNRFVNYIRFTLKNWNTGIKRIAQIFGSAFDSDGVAEAYLSREGGTMYGKVSSTDKIALYGSNAAFEIWDGARYAIGNAGDISNDNYGDGGVWSPGAGLDNVRFSSWYSIGFHDNCFGHDYISMNVRDGIFRAKKLQDADTGKQTSIGDLATATELDEVRKIAEGKTATYAVNAQKVDSTKYCNNKLNIAKSVLDTNSVKIDKQGVTKLLDINNKEIDLSTLQVGDIVFTAEQTIKDWWFAGTTAAYFVFYGFDADTPDLSGYVKNTDLANYTPLTDFNNLKDSLGTASKCDYVETIKDSLIDTSTPGILKKKELPTSGAVRTFVNTLFVRKSNLGAAANYAVDTTSDSISKDSTNLPTTGAMVAYVENNYLKKTTGFGTAAYKDVDTGNIQYPGSKEKVPTSYAMVDYVKGKIQTKINLIKAGTNNGETYIESDYTHSSSCIVKGLNNAAYKDIDETISSVNGATLSTNLPTSAAVAKYMAANLKTINGNSLFGSGDVPLTVATLPSTGSMSSLALTDRLDLQNAPYGIKFSSAAYAVTNMEAGEVEIYLGKSVGNDASASVSFHAGSKGQGTWKVLATVTGKAWVTSVTCTIESITAAGFKIWVRRLVDTSSNSSSGTITVDWIAIKYW